jgi:hypothetical protein
MLKQLWNDELGVIISAELVLVLTIAVLAMVVGLHAVAKSVTQELNDLSSAFGALDQSYSYSGLANPKHAAVRGSAFMDSQDDCDCTPIIQRKPRPKRDGKRPENGGRRKGNGPS